MAGNPESERLIAIDFEHGSKLGIRPAEALVAAGPGSGRAAVGPKRHHPRKERRGGRHPRCRSPSTEHHRAAPSLSLPAVKGVIAAGHPLTAQAGADVLRDGGNAVDAAVAAVLMSFVTESPLTGPGAGGFMLVHTATGETHLLDFFVAVPGRGLTTRTRPARADRRRVRRGGGTAIQLRAIVVRRLRHHRRVWPRPCDGSGRSPSPT